MESARNHNLCLKRESLIDDDDLGIISSAFMLERLATNTGKLCALSAFSDQLLHTADSAPACKVRLKHKY